MKSKIAYVISEDLNSALIKTQVIQLIEHLEKLDIEVILYHRNKSYKRKGFIYYQSIFNLINELYKYRESLSVIHLRGYYPLIYIGFILRLLKFKIVWDPRGIQPEEYWYQKKNLKGILGYIFFKAGEFNCIKSSKVIVCVSNAMANYFSNKSIYRKECNSYVIPTLSSPDIRDSNNKISRQELYLKPNDIVFCFCGSLSKWQRFDETCKIVSDISKINEKIKFLVLTKDLSRARSILNRYFNESQYKLLCVESSLVIDYLRIGDYGLLVRENILLNRVSSPVKLNDYLMAGLYTFASSCIGDIKNTYEKYDIGQTFENKNDAIEKILTSIKNNKKINGDHRNKYIIDYLNKTLITEKYLRVYEEI